MSDLLAIGASGLRAYQTALDATSQNIANAATAGYARRSAVISEVGGSPGARLGQTVALTGNGSRVTALARAGDAFRTASVRSAGADLARTSAMVTWLEQIESALTGDALGERLTGFFTTATGVAADPAATAPRVVMLEGAAALADAFAGTGRALARIGEDLAAQGQDAARSLSDLADALSRVNRSLTRTPARSSLQAELFDERDRLLEGMSALIDVDVAIDDAGRATVRSGSAVIADIAGSAAITFSVAATGAVSLSADRGTARTVLSPGGGALAGLIDAAARIAGTRETLDALATDVTSAINAFQAAGDTLSGVAGAPLFATGVSPTDLSLAMTDPRGIAAAAPGEGMRGNGNLAALARLRNDAGWEGRIDDAATATAALLGARRGVADAQGAIHTSAVAARDGVAGVDLDEEAIDLIRFQQAYQASSRVVQVARDILQTIIDIR